MNKIIFFITCVFLYSYSAHAQMVDLLSNLAIQGQMGAQGAAGLKTSFSLIQQNDIVNKLNMIIMDAKIRNDKQHIKKSQFSSYSLNSVEWDIYPVNSRNFYLLLKNIDSSFCNKLKTSFQYKELYINDSQSNSCADKNILKFIF